MTDFAATNGATVVAENICLLYDPATGTVRHRHSAITITGGYQPAQDEIERDALTYAANAGLDTSGVQILHVPAAAMATPGVYRVDPQTRTLSLVRPSPTGVIRTAPIRLQPIPIAKLPDPT
jgi:hypothetical protein